MAKPDKQEKIRYESYEDASSPLLTLPQVPAWGNLYLEILRDLGYARPSAMGGLLGLDFTELWCYFDLMGLELTADEVRLIFRLSKSYANQYNVSVDIKEPAPYITDETERELRAEKGRLLKESLRAASKQFQDKQERKQRRVIKNKVSK